MNISIEDSMTWSQNKLYNPITKHKIKLNGKTYNTFEKKYNEFFPNNYSYIDSIEDRDVVSFELFWIETNGIKKMVYKNIANLLLYKENDIVHCFEKSTLEYMKYYNINSHPVTNKPLPPNIFNNIKKISIDCDNISDKAKDVFTLLTNISIFIDSELFIKLNNRSIDKLYYETKELYRENLPDEIKNNLNIFIINVNKYNCMTIKEKQLTLLGYYEKLLKYSPQLYIANYIIIGALSLVIPQIKDIYPDIVLTF